MSIGNPRAVVEITADSRALGARLREASGKLASFAASSAKVVGRYGGASAATLGGPLFDPKFYAGMGKWAKRGGAAVAGALVVGASQLRDFEEGLIRLQINGNATAAQIDAVREAVRSASSATGVDSRKILAGVQQYVDLTGDFAGATRQIDTFARTAQASDSAVADVAQTAAAMRDALKIDPGDMEAAFSAMVSEGKAGSVTMKQLATELAGIAPTMAQFKGGTGLAGLRDLGAMIQVINRRYNSASESATAFQSMAVAFQSRAGKLKAAGVNVFDVGPDGTKRLRNILEIVDDIGRSKLMKDPTLLYKTLGRAEAIAPLQTLIRLRAELDEIRKAGQDTGAIGRDLATYNESKVGKFNRYYNKGKEAAQGAAADLIDRGIKGYAGLSMLASGEGEAVMKQRRKLEGEDAALRKYDLAVIMRYAAQGLTIGQGQARQVWQAEDALRWQEAQAKLGLAPAVTDEQRAQLRQFQTVTTGAPTPEEALAGAAAAMGGAPWLAMGQAAQVGGAGVDANGQKFTSQLSYALEGAFTRALEKAGLGLTVKVGADAVLAATSSAPARRRRP